MSGRGIYGIGFKSTTGGFEKIRVDGVEYTDEEVRRALVILRRLDPERPENVEELAVLFNKHAGGIWKQAGEREKRMCRTAARAILHALTEEPKP